MSRPTDSGEPCWLAFAEEPPGANTQGETIDEACANLAEAVALVLEASRAVAEGDLRGADAIREPPRLTV